MCSVERQKVWPSPSGQLEELDANVSRVGDVQAVICIDPQPSRSTKLAHP